jgi:hypothetical protein
LVEQDACFSGRLESMLARLLETASSLGLGAVARRPQPLSDLVQRRKGRHPRTRSLPRSSSR